MNFTTLYEKWNTFSFGKKVGFSMFLLFLLTITLLIFIVVLSTLRGTSFGVSSTQSLRAPGIPSYGYATDKSYNGSAYNSANYVAPQPYSASSITKEAEKYELSSYNANIESGNIDEDCKKVQNLKADESIIFINANLAKTYCGYAFKVEKVSVQKVIDMLKSVDPKVLSENVQTIQQALTNYERRKEILENQLTSIDSTLKEAVKSYEELSALAVKSRDTQRLALAINNKIDIIDRLSTKKLTVEEELRLLTDASSDDKNDTQYAMFTISISKDTFIDKEAIVSSWKSQTKILLNDINSTLQDVTLGFFSILFSLLKYILYFLTLVILLKYIKRVVVWLWNK